MKTKTLLPLILLATVPGIQATELANNIHLYGRVHFEAVAQKNADFNLVNAGHRLGIRGVGKTNAGHDTFFIIETEYQNDQNGVTANSSRGEATLQVRLANAGLKTDIGSVTIGRMNNPLNSTYVADVFERNSGAFEQSAYRIAHTLKLQPKLNGPFDVYAGLIANGEKSDSNGEEDLDGYMAGLSFKHMDLVFNLAYQNMDFNDTATNTDFEDISAGLVYTKDALYLGLNYEMAKENSVDTSVIDLAATYNQSSITYGFGFAVRDRDGMDEAYRWLIGAYYRLGGNADTYIEYADYNKEAGNGDNLVWGYRMKF